MKLLIKTSITVILFILLVNFSACNENNSGYCFKTKEDSIAFVKNVIKLYPELCNTNEVSKSSVNKIDTIKLPENFEKKDKLKDGFYYKYFRVENYLISKNPSDERGFNLAAKASGPIPLSEANRYIENYKIWVNGAGASENTKQFSYIIDSAEIGALTRLPLYHGIRVYMGMRVRNNSDSQTVVLTAYKQDSSDVYIPNVAGEMAIDKVTPCPWDCPCLKTDTRRMLGRLSNDPNRKPN